MLAWQRYQHCHALLVSSDILNLHYIATRLMWPRYCTDHVRNAVTIASCANQLLWCKGAVCTKLAGNMHTGILRSCSGKQSVYLSFTACCKCHCVGNVGTACGDTAATVLYRCFDHHEHAHLHCSRECISATYWIRCTGCALTSTCFVHVYLAVF